MSKSYDSPTVPSEVALAMEQRGWEDRDLLGVALEWIDSDPALRVAFVARVRQVADEEERVADGLAEESAAANAAKVGGPKYEPEF